MHTQLHHILLCWLHTIRVHGRRWERCAAMHFALRIATEHTANVTPDLYERIFCLPSVAFLRLFRILRGCLGEQMLVLRLISRNTFGFTRNCDGV